MMSMNKTERGVRRDYAVCRMGNREQERTNYFSIEFYGIIRVCYLLSNLFSALSSSMSSRFAKIQNKLN